MSFLRSILSDWVGRVVFIFFFLLSAFLVTVISIEIYSEITEIDSGVVVDKAHYPDEHLWVPVYTSCGNGCSIMTVVYVYVPECWSLFYRDGEETGDVCVPKQDWDRTTEGMWWEGS